MPDTLRTVLIFAHECAPYHRPQSTAGAQRPAQFARHLPDFGWRAIVVCCDWRVRERGTLRQWEALPGAVADQIRASDARRSVVIATPSWPSDGVLDRCWRRVLPIDGRDTAIRAALRRPLTAAKFMTGDYSQPWQAFARRAAEVIAALRSVDVCVGGHGPDAGVFLARWFSSRYGVPWVADFRDPILQPLTPFARRLYAPQARRLLASAAAVVNVTPVWAEMDRLELGRPSASIPNGFDPDEFRPAATPSRNAKLTIAYAGTINAAQRIDIFCEGLARARVIAGEPFSQQVVFVYRGTGGGHVRRVAASRGVADLIEVRDHVSREAALIELSHADLLLLLSIADPAREDRYMARGFYPAKTFDYFGVRRPILCVPGDTGLLDALIAETRTGVIRKTPEEIAQHLIQAWREWTVGRPLTCDVDEEALARYTRHHLSGRLAELLDRVCGVDRGADAASISRIHAAGTAPSLV